MENKDPEKYIYCILKKNADVQDAWQMLETAGVQVLYASEDAEGHAEIFAVLPEPSINLKMICPDIDHIKPAALPETDWSTQWELHGHNFYDGYAHIDLSAYQENTPLLRLQPGPGFGDLSHPTTQLVLKMMVPHVKGRQVIDIGCGSGILGLCAALLGAQKVIGIDIETEALTHARQNAELNDLQQKSAFILPENIQVDTSATQALALMNMIWSEQISAWESLQKLHKYIHTIVTSGILSEERDAYLTHCSEVWGWTFREEQTQDGWHAFLFIINTEQVGPFQVP